MKALGVPDDVELQGISDAEIRSFAGEAFAAPCAATVLFAFYANPFAPWWGDRGC